MQLARRFFSLFAIWVILSSAQAQSAERASASDRQQILQLERDWTHSFVTNDAAANNRIVADDYLGTTPDGKRLTKSELIAGLKTEAPLQSDRLNENDVTVRFYGDVVVLNGSETWRRQDGRSGRNIWTDVFVKRNGKWQVVASQDLEVQDRK